MSYNTYKSLRSIMNERDARGYTLHFLASFHPFRGCHNVTVFFSGGNIHSRRFLCVSAILARGKVARTLPMGRFHLAFTNFTRSKRREISFF